MAKLFKYLTKKDLAFISVSILLILGQVWLELLIPQLMAGITMMVQTPGNQLSEILSIGGSMLGAAFFSLVLSIFVTILFTKVSTNFAANLRELLFNKVLGLSLEDIGGFSTSSLITRSTNDITQIQMFLVMGMQMLIKSPIMATWAILRISNKNWIWTLSTAVAVLILFLVIGVSMMLAVPKFKLRQKFTDALNRVTRENLTGINVIRAYNAEDYQFEKFEEVNTELTDTNLFVNRVMAFMHPSINIVLNGLTLAIYWIGAYLIRDAQASEQLLLFSDMVVFSTYAMQVIMSLLMLVMVFAILPGAQVSAKRIFEVLDTESKILDGRKTSEETELKGEVEFNHVSFSYPNAEENLLEDISFKVQRGDTVAIIGSTGSGKSTLINLIPRFYDVSAGEVLVNGMNVKDYTLDSLNNIIGYVTQKAFLFSGNINENIAYGDNGKMEPTQDEIIEAANIAQASEFIEKLDDQYEANVAQGGTNYSGGQKQRISIARAIARKPEILIFDDSFSALDYKTDRELRHALKETLSDTTKIIVAQRVGTIKDADQIIVLEEGKIVGKGTHEELLGSNEVYQEIAYSQMSKEELA